MRKKFDCNDIRDFLTPKEKPSYMLECGSPSIELDIDLASIDIQDLFSKFLGALRGMHIWFHAAHVMSKGTGFSGDHVHIYGKIYQEITDQLDASMEKVLGMTDNESLLCPKRLTKTTAMSLDLYDSPENASAFSIAQTGLQIEKNFLTALEILYHASKEQGIMTLGLEDFMATLANTHEGYVYLLQQRVKKHLD